MTIAEFLQQADDKANNDTTKAEREALWKEQVSRGKLLGGKLR